MPKKPLMHLLQRQDIWQASTLRQEPHGIDTGFSRLNRVLYQRGWPKGGLTEILPDRSGGAELLLLLPSLARLSRNPGWLVLISPPYIPFAPAWQSQGVTLDRVIVVRPRTLAEQLWCTEQALKLSGNSVISWLPHTSIRYSELRKLQIASQQTPGLSALIRPDCCAAQNSPAHLRARLRTHNAFLSLTVLKQPGGWAGQELLLPLSQQLIQQQLSAAQLPVHKTAQHYEPQHQVNAEPPLPEPLIQLSARLQSASHQPHVSR